MEKTKKQDLLKHLLIKIWKFLLSKWGSRIDNKILNMLRSQLLRLLFFTSYPLALGEVVSNYAITNLVCIDDDQVRIRVGSLWTGNTCTPLIQHEITKDARGIHPRILSRHKNKSREVARPRKSIKTTTFRKGIPNPMISHR